VKKYLFLNEKYRSLKWSNNLFTEEWMALEVFMDLMKKDDREIMLGKNNGNSQKIEQFRKRISDESYLDEAIEKIATDLSHYLTK